MAKRSRLSLDLEFNIPRVYYLMNNSFMECFVHYLMDSYCTCVRSTTLDNFALDQTSLDKKQSSRLHSTRWPNALDISLNMHVERCIVKNRERLARALEMISRRRIVFQVLDSRANKVKDGLLASYEISKITSYYIKPAARADLQISLGKTRHVHPNCVFTLENRTFMTSHVTAKEHVTP